MSKELTLTEQKVQEVIDLYPHTASNNTELLISFIEHFLKINKKDITYMAGWVEAKDLMRSYGNKPESIVRARRKIKPSTKTQKQEEIHRTHWSS